MKLIARLSLPLAAALLVGGCSATPQENFAQAQASFAARDYAAARIAVSAALREEPGNVEMLKLLVRSQLGLGDGDGADAALQRLVGAGARGADVNLMSAELALLKQKPEEALRLASSDNSPPAWRVRAEAYLSLKQPEKAIDAYRQGMVMGDDLTLATSYARYLLQNDQPEDAVGVLARMKKMAPNAYETQVLAGDLAVAQDNTDMAIAAYRTVTKNFPDRVEPFLALAGQLDEKGKVDDALGEVSKAEKLAAYRPDVQAMKVQLLSEKGEWAKIRDALQKDEGSLDPASGVGMTYAEAALRLGHPEQARMMFSRATLAIPGNPYARMMLGESQLATGDAAGAWTTLKPLSDSVLADGRILELAEKAARGAGDPEADVLRARLQPQRLKAAQALNAKAQAALIRQDWNAAIPLYERVIAGSATPDPEVLKRLALASSKLGRNDAAIAYADRALAIKPNNADYLHMAGLTRLNARTDLPAAVRYLQAAVTAEPRSSQLQNDLAKAKAAAG